MDLLRAPEVERLQASLLDRSGADAVIPTCATQVRASCLFVLPFASFAKSIADAAILGLYQMLKGSAFAILHSLASKSFWA